MVSFNPDFNSLKHPYSTSVIQLAKLSGFAPIITTASSQNTAYLQSLGATHVLDRHLDLSALKREVENITQLPIDIVYDAISEPTTQQLALELLSANGTLVLTLPASVGDKSSGKKIKNAMGTAFVPGTEEIIGGLYTQLESYLNSGIIQVCISTRSSFIGTLTQTLQTNKVEIIPGGLDGIVVGLERMREGKVSGTKLVVHPQETP